MGAAIYKYFQIFVDSVKKVWSQSSPSNYFLHHQPCGKFCSFSNNSYSGPEQHPAATKNYVMPLCGLSKPISKCSEEELNERDLYALTNWLHDEANILTSRAVEIAKLFIRDGLTNMKRVAKHVHRNPNYLKDLKILSADIEEITDAVGASITIKKPSAEDHTKLDIIYTDTSNATAMVMTDNPLRDALLTGKKTATKKSEDTAQKHPSSLPNLADQFEAVSVSLPTPTIPAHTTSTTTNNHTIAATAQSNSNRSSRNLSTPVDQLEQVIELTTAMQGTRKEVRIETPIIASQANSVLTTHTDQQIVTEKTLNSAHPNLTATLTTSALLSTEKNSGDERKQSPVKSLHLDSDDDEEEQEEQQQQQQQLHKIHEVNEKEKEGKQKVLGQQITIEEEGEDEEDDDTDAMTDSITPMSTTSFPMPSHHTIADEDFGYDVYGSQDLHEQEQEQEVISSFGSSSRSPKEEHYSAENKLSSHQSTMSSTSTPSSAFSPAVHTPDITITTLPLSSKPIDHPSHPSLDTPKAITVTTTIHQHSHSHIPRSVSPFPPPPIVKDEATPPPGTTAALTALWASRSRSSSPTNNIISIGDRSKSCSNIIYPSATGNTSLLVSGNMQQQERRKFKYDVSPPYVPRPIGAANNTSHAVPTVPSPSRSSWLNPFAKKQ